MVHSDIWYAVRQAAASSAVTSSLTSALMTRNSSLRWLCWLWCLCGLVGAADAQGPYYTWTVTPAGELQVCAPGGAPLFHSGMVAPFFAGALRPAPPPTLTASAYRYQEFDPPACIDGDLATCWAIASSKVYDNDCPPLTLTWEAPHPLTGLEVALPAGAEWALWKDISLRFDDGALAHFRLPPTPGWHRLDFPTPRSSRLLELDVRTLHNPALARAGCAEVRALTTTGVAPTPVVTGPALAETSWPALAGDGSAQSRWECPLGDTPPQLTLHWAAPQRLEVIRVTQITMAGAQYAPMQEVTLTFDAGPAQVVRLADVEAMQEVALTPPRTSRTLTLTINSLHPRARATLTGCAEVQAFSRAPAPPPPTEVQVQSETHDGVTRVRRTEERPEATTVTTATLTPDQRYLDLEVAWRYHADAVVSEDGVALTLPADTPLSYCDAAYRLQPLGAAPVRLSRWSPHLVRLPGGVWCDEGAEVLELDRAPAGVTARFFAYYAPLRDGVHFRAYSGAAPQPPTTCRRPAGDAVVMRLRLFIGEALPPLLPFRYPYAKDAVISFAEHTDFGTGAVNGGVPDYPGHAAKKTLAAFFGTSDRGDPAFGKRGLLGHHLRVTATVWPLDDEGVAYDHDPPYDRSYYAGGTLEAPRYRAVIDELHRAGTDIGAHRLTYSSLAALRDARGASITDPAVVRAAVRQGLDAMAPYNPAVWIDHGPRDAAYRPSEALAGSGADPESPLYVVEALETRGWRYAWASGQDNTYDLNAFAPRVPVPLLLYSHPALDAPGPADRRLLFFDASNALTVKSALTAEMLTQLAGDKGFNNVHAYFRLYRNDTQGFIRAVPGAEALHWEVHPEWEAKFALLEAFQETDRLWVRDFTTVADHLQAWSRLRIVDFGADWLTLRNDNPHAVHGVTLYAPAWLAWVGMDDGTLLPWVRNVPADESGRPAEGYVVLPELAAGATVRLTCAAGSYARDLPLVRRISHKHLAVTACGYAPATRTLTLTLGADRAAVTEAATVVIDWPAGEALAVERDGLPYADVTRDGAVLTLTTTIDPATPHRFTIHPLAPAGGVR
jgi:hypothetical protein